MKTGNFHRTLIGQVTEGVNNIKAMFTPTNSHVLYYHSGQQTLRAFRVSDGQLIGTLRPHAQITTWSVDSTGQKVAIGCQDGSLLTAFLFDQTVYANIQNSLASLPNRHYLADHLGFSASFLRLIFHQKIYFKKIYKTNQKIYIKF